MACEKGDSNEVDMLKDPRFTTPYFEAMWRVRLSKLDNHIRRLDKSIGKSWTRLPKRVYVVLLLLLACFVYLANKALQSPSSDGVTNWEPAVALLAIIVALAGSFLRHAMSRDVELQDSSDHRTQKKADAIAAVALRRDVFHRLMLDEIIPSLSAGGSADVALKIDNYKGKWANAAASPGYWGKIYLNEFEEKAFAQVLTSGRTVRDRMARVSKYSAQKKCKQDDVLDLVDSSRWHLECVVKFVALAELSGSSLDVDGDFWKDLEERVKNSSDSS